MGTSLKSVFVAVSLAASVVTQSGWVRAEEAKSYSEPETAKYSQRTLLKNWALSVCLAKVANDEQTKADANATAGAYLEFGRQPIKAYEAIHRLVDQYAARKYAGSIASEFNTMKCIDLFQSRELNRIVVRLTKAP